MTTGAQPSAQEGTSKTPADYFRDWESYAFGYGYGTGEEHILPEMHGFFALCHRGESFAYDHRELETDLGRAVAWLLINALCGVDVLEYGTSTRFGWLTPQGIALRHFVLAHTPAQLIDIATEGDGDSCSPSACNCGPRGYEEGRVCQNPFWLESAAVEYLKRTTRNQAHGA